MIVVSVIHPEQNGSWPEVDQSQRLPACRLATVGQETTGKCSVLLSDDDRPVNPIGTAIVQDTPSAHFIGYILPKWRGMDSEMSDLAGPIIGAVVSIGGGIWSAINAYRSKIQHHRLTVSAMINTSIELAMQYPHVESDDNCKKWPNPSAEDTPKEFQEKKERYDNYCCFVFNMIHTAWVLAKKQEAKIDEMLAFREYVMRHVCWWQNEVANLHFYAQDFRLFIQAIIDDLKRKGQCT